MMGREGDWECSGCGNRNYAFRCFCNRCKVPRLLVDNKTPPDSKWLPRIGDWICTGCTNNNYASREMCKKCGQPKEVAAMPAVAIPGASLPTHPTYFARAQYESRPADRYSLLQASTWSSVGNGPPGVPFVSQGNQPLPASNGWRNGDWFCRCGFHNYSSRTQCKKCNGSAPPAPSPSPLVNTAITALGTKRLASEELIHDWDNKRLNLGQQAYPYPGAERMWGSGGNQLTAIATTLPSGNSMMLPKQVKLQIPHVPAAPTLIGKGAKQWRDGDWMCTNCNNHNYASRSNCNRCKTERNAPAQPVSVA